MRNGSTVIEFMFLGFNIPKLFRPPLFSLFVLLYVFIICGNIMIIIVVRNEPKLHIPMYFFIANFSILEIIYTTVTVPRMMRDLIMEDTSISLGSCIVQFYCFMVCGANEHCLLAVLAFDRFIAICHPLRYSTIMKPKFCLQMVVSAWLLCLLCHIPTTWSLYKSEYCDANINHFFCDISPLLQISCSDSSKTGLGFYIIATIIILSCFCMICMSYAFILYTVLHIKSHSGLHQALSTCSSHLTVVTIFYSSCMFMYIRPSSHTFFHMDKIVAIAYVIVAPLLNPLIYTFRNKAMKTAIRNCVKINKSFL